MFDFFRGRHFDKRGCVSFLVIAATVAMVLGVLVLLAWLGGSHPYILLGVVVGTAAWLLLWTFIEVSFPKSHEVIEVQKSRRPSQRIMHALQWWFAHFEL